MAAKKQKQEVMKVPEVQLKNIDIEVEGLAPLLCHAWSKKVGQGILDKQMKKAKQGREAKDPERDFRESLYPLDGNHDEKNFGKGGFGFPALAFKSAAVTACTSVDGMSKVGARQYFHVMGDLVKIKGTPTLRADMVRIGTAANKPANIVFRGEFKTWSAVIPIIYNKSVISEEQLINLFNIAGFGVGVGEWRPEKNGQLGTFFVKKIIRRG